MAWVLTKNLTKLRTEFNALGPNRDRSTDGSVGDLAHQTGYSGHNPDRTGMAEWSDGDSLDEVRAIDVDKDGPWLYGQSMEKIVQHLVMRGRRGDYLPLAYIIYNGRIWVKSNGWATQEYYGDNPHDKHAHFSGDYSQKADNSADFNYGIANLGKPVEEDLPVKQTDFDKLMTAWAKSAAGREALAVAVLAHDPGADANGKIKSGGVENYTDDGSNPTVGVSWAISRAPVAADRLNTVLDLLREIKAELGQEEGHETPPPSGELPSHVLGSRTLQEGMYGTDVRAYQAFIGKVATDGFFGPSTVERTREYQTMRGLTATGVAGPETLGPIVEELK